MGYRKKIIGLVEKFGVPETCKVLGIGIDELFVITQQPIDCENALEIIYTLYEKGLLVEEYKGYRITQDSFSGTIEWDKKVYPGYPNVALEDGTLEMILADIHNIYVKASPFWENENSVPVDVEIFADGDDEYITDLFESYRTPESFENIEKLIIWFKEEYLEETYKIIEELYDDNYKLLIAQTQKNFDDGKKMKGYYTND